MTDEDSYTSLQISLHWLTAILIFAAYFTSDGMGRVLRERIESGATGIEGNTPHVWLGGAAMLVIIIRLIVRFRTGAPAAAEGTAPWLAKSAEWGHRLLYLVMFLVPIGGAAAWYGGVEVAGNGHEVMGNALMILAVGHIVMALLHEVVWGHRVLGRMFTKKG